MQPQPYVLLPPIELKAVFSEWLAVAIESHSLERYFDAERQLKHALTIDPNSARAYNNLACAYAAGQNYKEALLAIERATMLSEDAEVRGIAMCNWALVSLDLEQVEDAVKRAEQAVETFPCQQTRMALALCCPVAGTPERAMPLYNAVLDENPKHFVAAINSCFLQTLLPVGPADLLKQRKRFYEHQRQTGKGLPYHKQSINGKPLKVGYVSGDYRRHSAAIIFGGVLLHHSPRVEPYFYSTQPVDPANDRVSKKFKDYAGDRWRDICALSDEQAEEQVRKDKIDILVDLSGHTGGSRLGLFTRKPAPIQATAWGFAHGTGVPEIDYFFADPVAVPEAERQHYAEKIVDLPCIVTFEPPPESELPAISAPPAEKNRYVTFGCYSRYEKLSTAYLATCQEILLEVPNSRMVFKDNAFRQPHAVGRVQRVMDRVNPRRLSFFAGSGQGDHMLSYQFSDLILDPFPHSGGTCCLEQLWMGVPIVTLYGTQAGGRTTSSVLTAMRNGRDSWIARTRDDYIRLAVDLSGAYRCLIDDARKTLRQELLDSPVCKGYVAAVENVYVALARSRCA